MKQDNQKQAIEEMRKDLVEIFDEEYERRRIITADFTAIKMSAKGYRKQIVVIDEFAKRLKEKMDDLSRMEYNDEPCFLVRKAFIDKIAEEMKGGAE
jgi:vacuolar-type H+-ATPase subunit E/Vma4